MRESPLAVPAPLDKGRKAAPRQVEIRGPGFLSLLFECVEDIHRLWVLRHVQDAESATGMDSDFNYSASYGPQRLPVVGQQALLDPVELRADLPSRLVRERPYIFEGGTQPDDRLVGHMS